MLDLAPDAMYKRDLPHVLLLTARKTITIKRMNPQPPTVAQWKQRLMEVNVMEALTAKLQSRSDVLGKGVATYSKVPLELKGITVDLIVFNVY